jgi:hypothetical protein
MTVDLEDYGVTNLKQLREADKTLGLHQVRASSDVLVSFRGEEREVSFCYSFVLVRTLTTHLNAGASCGVRKRDEQTLHFFGLRGEHLANILTPIDWS